MLEQGDSVYELYAIMIHNGGAYGGHYFAYIKDCAGSGEWSNYNDSTVSKISEEELLKTFGGEGNNTAYMLLYRKYDGSKEIKQVPELF
jgi:ubiquitin carboxyl-terminal hydrolase 47